VLFVGSTAGLVSYEGGASYTASKHGVHTLAETLRLELNGEPVRVIEIAPGMVRTEEFSLNRLGSADAADAVYRGVREPLVAEDVADCIGWAVTRPHHVNIDLMVIRPLAQAAQHKVHREI
jgi:NADP-dependent 3-hydroxy acid dehydrogenase YdfG